MSRKSAIPALLIAALGASSAAAQPAAAPPAVPAPATAPPANPAAPAVPPAAPAPSAPAAAAGTTPALAPGAGASPDAEAKGVGLERFTVHLDPRNGLTSTAVARRAVSVSPSVESARASAKAAKAVEDRAVARLWPRLSLSARYTRLSDIQQPTLGGDGLLVVTGQTTPGPIAPGSPLFGAAFSFPILLDQYELKAALSVPVSDYVYRTGTAIEAAEHSASSARYQEQAAKRRTAADARLAYYDWVRALGQHVVAEQSLEHARAQYGDAAILADAGLMSRADLLRAEAQVKNVEVLVLQAKNFAVVADERLRTIMHDDSERTYKVGEDLLSPLPKLPPPDTRALLREAIAQRAELRALRESEASLADVASLARSEAHPRLDLAGNAYYANPNPRVFPQQEKWDALWDASVVLSWTPTDMAAANASAREQEARILELRAQRRQLVDGLRLEITQAAQLVLEADAALEAGHQALAAAEESYRARRELFRSGKSTIVELNDAEVELTRARLAVINAHVDSRTARVRLDHALGRDRLP